MKKNYWILVVIFTVIVCLITGCMRPERTYEVIGLPNSEEIWNSLKIAIPLLIIGFLIAYNFVWRKKDTENVGSTSTKLGCLGMIVMVLGALFLIPLWAWVEYIFVTVLTSGFIIFIVVIIIIAIYSKLTGK